MSNKEQLVESLKEAILNGDEEAAKNSAVEFLKADGDPLDVFENHLTAVMRILGEKFEKQEMFLPELMMSADAMIAVSDILTDDISKKGLIKPEREGKVIIGTVYGDVHDIGKNMVSLLLRVGGFDVIDLGRDVPAMTFIENAEKLKADIIAASALMTSSMSIQREIVSFLNDMGLRQKYQVMLGGAPTSKNWADSLGADGWAESGTEAVTVAKRVIAAKIKP